jgi:hypothetical protein
MAWILPILTGIANVMEVVTFIQFIEEEAIQSAALGTFLALRSNSYRAAVLGIHRVDECCSHLELINEYFGWIAPYSQGCFYDFCKATRTNLEIYNDLLYARIKEYTKE